MPTHLPTSRTARALRAGAVPTALAVAAVLLASGCGAAAGQDAAGGKGATKVAITLTPDGCQAKPAKIAAGSVTFTVTNQNATKVSEAELLKEKIIVGEKENLTPGLSGTFSLKLESGKYSVYCPNAAKDTWPFEVTGTAAKSTFSPAVEADLKKATSGYRTYVIAETAKLQKASKRFTAAVRAGDTAKARNLFASARYYYEEVEPVAESFGNLDPDIDARVNDVSDLSKWSGFHRLEKALWKDKSLKGMDTYADKLDADVAKLVKLAGTTTYQPAQLANGATGLLNEVASSKITGEEDRYSHTDLSDFEANIVGGQKAFDLLKPALNRIDKPLATKVDAQYAAVLDSLKPYRGHYAGSKYVDYSTVDQSKRKVLTQKVDALAEPLSQVAAKVSG